MKENIVFTDVDFYNFSKACNLKVDMNYANENFFKNNMPKVMKNSKKTYVTSKSLLGPCYVHSIDVNPKKVNYNLSKIIKDLQLSKQETTPPEKLQKVIDYINLLG
jgi:hypothetical protein